MISLFFFSALCFLTFPSPSAAWVWTFQNTPQQCKNLTITITGSDGIPPYRALIVPVGPTTLPNNTEVRRIMDQPFQGNATTLNFQLNYPANSQFVAVISDSSGFGSGGTSVAAQVTTSSDSSCFDPTKDVQPDFVFSIEPPSQLVQCQPMRIWWDNNTVHSTPNFLGVIPGGQSFPIPEDQITNVQSQGTGFTWIPSLRSGTTLIIVGGDSRGNGTAGSSLGTVSNGPFNNGTCLTNTSPSSTPGSPAGGSYPTSVSGGTGGGASSSNNTGAIVGGVVGGIAFLLCIGIVFFFFRRHKRRRSKIHARPDLFTGDEGDDEPQMSGAGVNAQQNGAARRNELPEYYQPEPFNVPDPLQTARSDDDGGTSEGRPLSGYTLMSRSQTPDLLGLGLGSAGMSSTTSSGGRKGAVRQMRPVNVIQHDDAGPSEHAPLAEDEPETVELPPAYTNIRK